MRDTIIHGDCLTVLRTMPDESVQCIVTSPPYWGLRDYGVEGQLGLEKSPEEYTAKMVEVFRECRRVLRDDGVLWLNLGDSYIGGGRGFEYWTGNEKQSTNAGSAVKASPVPAGLKPKDLCGIPWRVAFALQSDGWYLRSDIIWSKPNPMPESVTDRPTKAHEYVFLMSRSERYYYDADAIAEPLASDPDSWGRHSKKDPGEQAPNQRPMFGPGRNGRDGTDFAKRRKIKVPGGRDVESGSHGTINRKGRTVGKYVETPNANGRGAYPQMIDLEIEARNRRSVWTVPTSPFPEAHFATFPPDLIKPMVLAGSRPGDVVLDPFMGAGTVALVAKELNRRYIGIELNADYIKIAQRRLRQEVLDFAPRDVEPTQETMGLPIQGGMAGDLEHRRSHDQAGV